MSGLAFIAEQRILFPCPFDVLPDSKVMGDFTAEICTIFGF